jgi:hypothetical protein
MTTQQLRERLLQEIEQLPSDRLAAVFDVLHFFRLGLEASPPRDGAGPCRTPSPRLRNQGAMLSGDDIAPAIPLADWGTLYQRDEGPTL